MSHTKENEVSGAEIIQLMDYDARNIGGISLDQALRECRIGGVLRESALGINLLALREIVTKKPFDPEFYHLEKLLKAFPGFPKDVDEVQRRRGLMLESPIFVESLLAYTKLKDQRRERPITEEERFQGKARRASIAGQTLLYMTHPQPELLVPGL